jgi:cytochrome c oxidase subunit 3
MNDVYYPDLSPLKTGLAGKCPRCGRGKLFNGYLTVADRCSNCGLSYGFADGGDGAAWFVMLFVCVAGVGSILGIEAAYSPPYWVHALIGIPVLIVLPLMLLRPAKGLLINQQWKADAREGRLQK